MLLHRGIKSKSEKTWGRDGQKSLPFLHTFDILEGSGVRHDNKSDNTQCMKIDEEENTYLTDLHRALAHSLKKRMGRGSIFFARNPARQI